MTTARKTTTVFLTVLSGLLLSIIGLTQRWPAWAWPLLAVLLLVVPSRLPDRHDAPRHSTGGFRGAAHGRPHGNAWTTASAR